MTTFNNNKEKAEENKYARDQELEFKIKARYHKLLAIWVAEKLSFDAEKTEAYKVSLVAGDLSKSAGQELLDKIAQEFAAHNVGISVQELREKMHDLHQNARQQVLNS